MKPVDVPKRHIANLSKALANCGPQATAYGKCVSVKAEVTKHACSKEFEALIKCIKEATQTVTAKQSGRKAKQVLGKKL